MVTCGACKRVITDDAKQPAVAGTHVCMNVECPNGRQLHSLILCSDVWMPAVGNYLCGRRCLEAHNERLRAEGVILGRGQRGVERAAAAAAAAAAADELVQN